MRCWNAAHGHVSLQDDDTLLILQETPDEPLRGKVDNAIRSCPKQAISWQD